MTFAAMALAAVVATASPSSVAAQAEGGRNAAETAYPVAILRGLDKFSGLTHDFSAVVDAPVRYARLSITVRACVGQGEHVEAYLEITDLKRPESPIFAGWMMSESPALSALDHPRFDVWVLSCSTRSGEAS